MDVIDKRKQARLKALIIDYVNTCEPVASQRLVDFYDFNVRGATIRSEMNEMAALGFLCQPHKSGGRIPTDLGYRFFVDNLLDRIKFDKNILNIVSEALKSKAEVEALVKSATQMLSDITGFVAVASYPKINNSKLKYIAVSDCFSDKNDKKLFVLAFSNGYIIHKIMDFSIKNKIYSLENAINYLYHIFLDRDVDYIINYKGTPCVYDDIISVMKVIVSEYSEKFNLQRSYSYEGVGKILNFPEFKDLDRLSAMLSALENGELLTDIFKYTTEEVSVKIGTENLNPFMKDLSLVSCCYKVCGSPAGVIGIIGPTRMDYAICIAGVEVISKNLGNMLTGLSS